MVGRRLFVQTGTIVCASSAAAIACGAIVSGGTGHHAAAARQARTVGVIVRERAPASDAAERMVRRLGGTVGRELPIVAGFAARVPTAEVPVLRRATAVAAVWPDARVHMSDAGPAAPLDAMSPPTPWRDAIHLPDVSGGYDGAGVTVALLDTGVADVPDLAGRVTERVDLTSEQDGLDHYGHGTHMAGLIDGDGTASHGLSAGVAPAAGIVSVKVAGADGSTDVSTVLAGLQWVATNEDRLNVRVLNLSFGTDSTQSAAIDPLDYAVEQLWQSGVLVVVAAGNRGPSDATVNKPADDPYVLTVGAADPAGAPADFSSRGPTPDGFAKPDLIAPGTSIVSTRAPGSTVDVANPAAQVDDAYFKGTGTSQAAAITSGVAALLFQACPTLTPDEAKAVLTSSANGIAFAASDGAGAGLIDAAAAVAAVGNPIEPANAGLTPSTGLGSLEASRGSLHVLADVSGNGVPTPVTGEVDVVGQPWDAKTWSAGFWSSLGWDFGHWSTTSWIGFDAKTWSAKTWSTGSWN